MTAAPRQLSRFRFGLRSLLIGVTVVASLVAYLAAYWRLAEQGRTVQREAHMPGFFYVKIGPEGYDVFWHRTFMLVFYPVNQLDQMILGGSPPCSGGTTGIGGSTPQERATFSPFTFQVQRWDLPYL